MATAHHRNGVLADKFWFRKNLFPARPISNRTSPATTRPPSPAAAAPVEDEYELMSINEIMNGKDDGSFVGLIPLIESYLDTVNVDVETRCELAGYLGLVRKRASGELKTGATWIREFVRAHPDYKNDSVVSESINYDLMKAVEELGRTGWLEGGNAAGLLGRRRE